MLSRVSTLTKVLAFLCPLLLSVSASQAQTYRLRIDVDDMYHFGPLPPQGDLRVFITNPIDSIAGFSLWLQTSRPDVIKFKTSGLAAYLDSVGGTIAGNFEYLHVRSVAGDSSDIRIAALAEGNLQPPINRGIGPSNSSRLLLRIPYDIVPGTDTIGNPQVSVTVNTQSPLTFGFSTPEGLTIPCFDTAAIPALDTVNVRIQNGGVFVEHCTCLADGDANGDGIGLSVSDLVHTLRAVQGVIDAPDSLCHADFNSDCRVDTADTRIYKNYFDSGLIVFGWPPFPRPTCCYVALKTCCSGLTGNIDCDPESRVDISDLAALLDHLYISLSSPCCWGAANVDDDAGRGVDIADLSALIDYLYVSYRATAPCR